MSALLRVGDFWAGGGGMGKHVEVNGVDLDRRGDSRADWREEEAKSLRFASVIYRTGEQEARRRVAFLPSTPRPRVTKQSALTFTL